MKSLVKFLYFPIRSAVYNFYEHRLEKEINRYTKPQHIGIILDGNRRWARNHSLPESYGHKYGAQIADNALEWCLELGIKTVTVYVTSTENLLERPKEEVEQLLSIAEERLTGLLTDPRIPEYRVRVKALGDMPLLPTRLQDIIAKLEEMTKDYDGHYLNIGIAYGGRHEITNAIKTIADKVQKREITLDDIDENLVSKYLYTAHLPNPEPDVIIRTSGEERTSGFMLWQGAYSELIFQDVFWPDFRKIDLMRAIRTYQRRERRFGT